MAAATTCEATDYNEELALISHSCILLIGISHTCAADALACAVINEAIALEIAAAAEDCTLEIAELAEDCAEAMLLDAASVAWEALFWAC